MAGEKTEKATPKRKQDERKKGNIFMSQEAVTAFSLLATFYSLKVLGPMIFTQLQSLLITFINLGATVNGITLSDVRQIFIQSCLTFALAAMPLLLISSIVAIIITMAQTKLLFSSKAFAFKANRLNPLSGLKKLFSMRSFIELLKSLLKITILGYVIYTTLKDEVLMLPRMMDMDPLQCIIETGTVVLNVALKAGAIFVALAAADYLYQWWEYEKNLRMSKQEIKDEYKQTEGDPQIKGAIRNRQQQQSKRRMMQNVPNADVVIRNPTHYAIAIKYDSQKYRAPVVIAKGVDSLALRIVKVAEGAGVYVTEDRPLARALYESVELDQEVPERFYQALAQVLAFVYSLKKKD